VSDIQLIEDLGAQIWKEHYTPIIGKEQVAYMLQKFQTAQVIQQQIEDGLEYYLIKYKQTDVGYFSIKKETDAIFLSKFYVLKKQRGKGIGKFAMNFIENIVHSEKLKYIRLTVNKYNTNSIQAYKKMGFSQLEAVVFDIGNGFIMDDFRMEKKLL